MYLDRVGRGEEADRMIQAAREAATMTGQSRSDLYQIAISIDRSGQSG